MNETAQQRNRSGGLKPFPLLTILMILAITFAAFYPTLKNDFLNWDDRPHLIENTQVRSLDGQNILNIFQDTVNKTYIPLTTLSFALEYHFAGYDPAVYHRDNLLLHMGIVALIFLFATSLGLNTRAAGAAALLFAIHPMHVESVAWVTERKDVLYAFFYMLALVTYIQYTKKQKIPLYILSLLFGLLSILSKAMALSLPLALLACDYLLQRKWSAKVILEKLPYFLYIIPIAWITYSLNARVPGRSVGEAIIIWFHTLTFYIQKFFIPINLSPLYGLPRPVTIGNFAYILPFLIVAALAFLLWRCRRQRLLVFSFLFYFVSIFFLLRFDLGKDVTIVADRFMYLPSLGLCLLLGKIIADTIVHSNRLLKVAAAIGVAALFLGLGLSTFQQGKIWKDTLTLWDYAIEKNPEIAKAYEYRGKEYNEQGKFALAMADHNKAISLNPESYLGYSNRGMTYTLSGQYGLAIADLDKAAGLNPEYPQTHNTRGDMYLLQGLFSPALTDLNKAIKLSSKTEGAYVNRASLYLRQGQINLAQADINKALAINPFNGKAFYNRGLIYAAQQDYQHALEDLNKAIQLDPNQAEFYVNRGSVYYKQERYNDAMDDFNQALLVNPYYAAAYSNRSLIYALSGDIDRAIEDAMQAMSLGHPIDPKYIQGLRQLKAQRNLDSLLENPPSDN